MSKAIDELRYKATVKMDLTIVDEYHKKLVKNKTTEPLGDSITLEGTVKEIKAKLSEMIDDASWTLEDWYYGEDEETGK